MPYNSFSRKRKKTPPKVTVTVSSSVSSVAVSSLAK